MIFEMTRHGSPLRRYRPRQRWYHCNLRRVCSTGTSVLLISHETSEKPDSAIAQSHTEQSTVSIGGSQKDKALKSGTYSVPIM
mmetsp:Transcript_22094/g.43823  ORF Transcript_22094/g.43823 Transcript_22094/m.43823 type:complete len:83 (+) Transcript_22094:168-416(+)